jgi:hypothetical protein
VARYFDLESSRDAGEISKLISRRFTERYLDPTLADQNVKHGFTTMAIACLMVEALESFRQGWTDTTGRSKQAFCSFFDAHDEFALCRGHAESFWHDIRCGILHQAETRGGWLILRRGPLIDSRARSVNASAFMHKLERVLNLYCRELAEADWESPVWKKCRGKLNAICAAAVGP